METALERVRSLAEGRRLDLWSIHQLASLGHEAKRRWLAIRQEFGLDVSLGGDAVALIDPEFNPLSDDEEKRIQKMLPGVSGRVAFRFLKWATHPKTAGAENPLEPLLEILEHGGFSRVEHGIYLDIYDASGAMCGIVLIR